MRTNLQDRVNRRSSAPDSAAMKNAILFGNEASMAAMDDVAVGDLIRTASLSPGSAARTAVTAALKSPIRKKASFWKQPATADELEPSAGAGLKTVSTGAAPALERDAKATGPEP